MKKKGIWIAVSAFLVLGLLTVGFGCAAPAPTPTPVPTPTPTPTPETYYWRFAHGDPRDQPSSLSYELFAKLVKDETEGRVNITLYHDAQLGDYDVTVELTQGGALEFCQAVPWGAIHPGLDATNFPYVISSMEEADKVYSLDGALGKMVDKIYQEINIKIIGYQHQEFRHISSTKPIRSLADLKGVKMRVMPSPMLVTVWENFGATPTPLPWGEVYTALELGTIDAQDNGPIVTYLNSIHEVQPYYTLTYHQFLANPTGMRLDLWDSLTPELQGIIMDASAEADAYSNSLTRGMYDESLAAMAEYGIEIIELTPEAKKEFVEKGRGVWPKLKEQVGAEYYEALMAIVK